MKNLVPTLLVIIIIELLVAGYLLQNQQSANLQTINSNSDPAINNEDALTEDPSSYYLVYTAEVFSEEQNRTYFEVIREPVNGETDPEIIYTVIIDGQSPTLPEVTKEEDYIVINSNKENTKPLIINLDGEQVFDEISKLYSEHGSELSFNADNSLAVFSDQEGIGLYDLNQKKELKRYPFSDFPGLTLDVKKTLFFSDQNTEVYMTTFAPNNSHQVYSLNIDSGEVKTVSSKITNVIGDLLFDEKNLEMFFARTDQQNFQISKLSLANGNLENIYESEFPIKNLMFAPNTNQLFFNIEFAIATLVKSDEEFLADIFIPKDYMPESTSDIAPENVPTNELISITPEGEYLIYQRSNDQKGILAVHKFKNASRLFTNNEKMNFVGWFNK